MPVTICILFIRYTRHGFPTDRVTLLDALRLESCNVSVFLILIRNLVVNRLTRLRDYAPVIVLNDTVTRIISLIITKIASER